MLNTRPVQSTLPKLTDRLMDSYAQAGGINHVDGKNLPSKRAIGVITLDLLHLLFPGFFDEKAIHSTELRAKTSGLLESCARSLEAEIKKSLEYNPPTEFSQKDLRSLAHTLTVEFFESL